MRVFNEKQVSGILKRAAELQAGDAGDERGLSLDELRAIAAEVGIDPRFVEQAAFETGRPAPKKQGFAFWGAPVRLTDERVLTQPVDEDEWGAMVEEMRRVYGHVGTVSEVGGTRTWSYGSRRTSTTAAVSLTQRRGRTYVTAQRNLDQEIAVTFAPAGSQVLVFTLLMAMGELFSLGVGFNIVAAAALFLTAFFGLRAIVGYIGRKEQRKMTDVLDRIERIAGESEGLGDAPVETPARAAARPASLLTGLEEAPEAPSDASRARTRAR